MTYWNRGEMIRLAKAVGLQRSHLSEILHRKRTVSRIRARIYERVSEEVLGKNIPWAAWIFNNTTKHPAFFGDPEKVEY